MGVFALIILALVIYLGVSAFGDGFSIISERFSLRRFTLSAKERTIIIETLNRITYYQQLSPAGQKKFQSRVIRFMVSKTFEESQGMLLTTEKITLISATAIQLTFGLNRYKLRNLEKIVVLPDQFRLAKNGQAYKGATRADIMYLSWKDFEAGLAANDNLNLGLHEMTHALNLSLVVGTRRYDELFAARIRHWEGKVREVFAPGRPDAHNFFRSYAWKNSSEFFSVCVEYFFENPEPFKRELPEIYFMMVFLLNQDPTNIKNDYAASLTKEEREKYRIPEKVVGSHRDNLNHWSVYVAVIGLICIVPGYLVLSGLVMLPMIGYLLMWFIFGTLGLLQRKYFAEREIMEGRFFAFYSYIGFGSLTVIAVLALNIALPVTDIAEERHRIESYHEVYSGSREKSLYYKINIEDELQYNNNLLTLKLKPPAHHHTLVVYYQRGILGIKIWKGYKYEP
jgi:Mlc titration factor MtfA (ptsG expression regulator)